MSLDRILACVWAALTFAHLLAGEWQLAGLTALIAFLTYDNSRWRWVGRVRVRRGRSTDQLLDDLYHAHLRAEGDMTVREAIHRERRRR